MSTTDVGQDLLVLGVDGRGPLKPLERAVVIGSPSGDLVVRDSKGRAYQEGRFGSFTVGGSLGPHTISVRESGKERVIGQFTVDASTQIADEGGLYRELLEDCVKTMDAGSEGGPLTYKGKVYRFFVHWVLDHVNVAKGGRYFHPWTPGLLEIFARAQKENGMVWSFVNPGEAPGYFTDAYAPYGYAKFEGGATFARQPVENHNEYMFVNGIAMAWQSLGDENWTREMLDHAVKALDYSVTDPARWSDKYKLLKRGYTVDSWDFQIVDEHLVQFPLGSAQQIDNQKTKFGIFFGDNHGYALACDQLSQMLAHFGRKEDAERFTTRAKEIRERLTALAWNGGFYRHWIPEDPSVKRDLGVDEDSQFAMSNAYALNRGIREDEAQKILESYESFRARLPEKSPGEWYAIYPPYERGMGGDNNKWQYMNGGVHGHAAGELARGAFSHGAEEYGADILRRLLGLARLNDGILKFAYTGGAEPPPPAQKFTPLDLGKISNMALDGTGSNPWLGSRDGNDLGNLPRGGQTFAGVPYSVSGALALGSLEGRTSEAVLPVGAKAGAVYLLHTSSQVINSTGQGVVGSATLDYEDGTSTGFYIEGGRDVGGWWYPSVKGTDVGVAWRGPNKASADVGVTWRCLANPHPEKVIKQIRFGKSLDPAQTYIVIGATLADRAPHHEPGLLSGGGPDNWTGGCVAAAVIEGLAGLKDNGILMEDITLSPRWLAAGVNKAAATIRYSGSGGYVAYRYERRDKQLEIEFTGSGCKAVIRLLLPKGAAPKSAKLNGRESEWNIARVGKSTYLAVESPLGRAQRLVIEF